MRTMMNVTEIYHIGGRGEIYSLTDKILNNFNEREYRIPNYS